MTVYQKACAWCTTPFTSTIAKALYCSTKCSHKMSDLRRGRRTTGPEADIGPRTPRPTGPAPGEQWKEQAACRDNDANLFFPDWPHRGGLSSSETAARQRQISEAKTVCAVCPVRAACGDYAVANGISDGIWGGLTEEELRRVTRQRRAS